MIQIKYKFYKMKLIFLFIFYLFIIFYIIKLKGKFINLNEEELKKEFNRTLYSIRNNSIRSYFYYYIFLFKIIKNKK